MPVHRACASADDHQSPREALGSNGVVRLCERSVGWRMSVQVMAWALEQRIVLDAPARHVLLCLANYADKDGRGAFPAVQRLVDDTGLSGRTVQRQLAALVAAGVIRPGNEAIVAAYISRADRRTVCYDIIMQRGDTGAPGERTRGDSRARHGVTATTERGVTVSPNPSDNHQKET
ncbi:hypothetical protein XOO2937 [Xanthomonas oryzae pv. oryzae KACC 10331]|uniref:Helix-turn-helix domain-containing protein n=2 Tax=Xanthomonas oryzae pv. oryzae TaxID=64187 RepID=Q5GYN0_XANOR|nr:hypothetical protein XOO2937 [Xanthomonas oryzae pv. oryzae KACC 10331]